MWTWKSKQWHWLQQNANLMNILLVTEMFALWFRHARKRILSKNDTLDISVHIHWGECRFLIYWSQNKQCVYEKCFLTIFGSENWGVQKNRKL